MIFVRDDDGRFQVVSKNPGQDSEQVLLTLASAAEAGYAAKLIDSNTYAEKHIHKLKEENRLLRARLAKYEGTTD